METQQPCKLSRVLLAHHQIDAMCHEALSAVEIPISLGVSHLKFSALASSTYLYLQLFASQKQRTLPTNNAAAADLEYLARVYTHIHHSLAATNITEHSLSELGHT
jgi:hypothetical protein